jgi:hypothetical protein
LASVGSTTISGVSDPRAGAVCTGGSRYTGAVRKTGTSGGSSNTSENEAIAGSGAQSGAGLDFSSPLDSGFAAELFAQFNGSSTISVSTPFISKQVSDAYQTASDLAPVTGANDIQVPGLPPRLSSGRLLDLVV